MDSALCCGQCFGTLWKRVIIREAGHYLPRIFVKKGGAVPLLHLYAFIVCTGTALTGFNLALLLTKCPVRLMRSPVWP